MESTVSHVVLAQSVFEMTSYAEHVYITSASLVNVVLCQVLVCNMIKRSLILIKGLLISFLPSFIKRRRNHEKLKTRETGLPCLVENLISAWRARPGLAVVVTENLRRDCGYLRAIGSSDCRKVLIRS